MQIYYITVFEGKVRENIGILDTQVFGKIDSLKRVLGKNIELISFFYKHNEEFLTTLGLKHGVKVNIYDIDKFILNNINIDVEFPKEKIYFICREVFGIYFAKKIISKNKLLTWDIILDKRGIPAEESFTFKQRTMITRMIRYCLFKVAEILLISKASKYIFVSTNMFNRYKKKYKNIKYDNSLVLPTGVSLLEKKCSIIERNEPGRKKSFIYSGNKVGYHCFGDILDFFNDLYNKYGASIVMIICSYFNKNELEFYKNKYPFINFYSNLPNEDVQKLMIECDYGIIFRKNNIVNYVAAPTKIAEYILNDLKVIYQGEIGVIDDLRKTILNDCFIERNQFISENTINQTYTKRLYREFKINYFSMLVHSKKIIDFLEK